MPHVEKWEENYTMWSEGHEKKKPPCKADCEVK